MSSSWSTLSTLVEENRLVPFRSTGVMSERSAMLARDEPYGDASGCTGALDGTDDCPLPVHRCRNVDRRPGDPCRKNSFGATSAWLLVTVHTEPVGSLVIEVPPEGLTGEQVKATVMAELGVEDREPARPDAERLCAPALSGLTPTDPFASTEMTVMVCTRERPERLEECLTSLLAQEYPNFSVLVIDNFPATDRTRAVVDGLASPLITYVVQPKKGLCRAKNLGVELAGDGIVASIDDDETADPHWLAELARRFRRAPRGRRRHRSDGARRTRDMGSGLVRTVRRPQQAPRLHACRVLPQNSACAESALSAPFVRIGGNVAFRTSSLKRIGGFDIALGPGTASMSNEDTRVFTDLLCSGGTVVYQPTAVTRHFHRRSVEELRTQMLGYGVGLTAFYASLVVGSPSVRPGTHPAPANGLSGYVRTPGPTEQRTPT